MDTGKGNFEMFEKLEEAEKKLKALNLGTGIFTVGEELEIRGSRFRIKAIGTDYITLRLLPKIDVKGGDSPA